MSGFLITEAVVKTKGRIHLPSSKSLSNRTLVIQRLCKEKFEIKNLSEANDTQELIAALNSTTNEIYTGEGGTTFRFLTALYAITEGEWTLRCSPSMSKRPVGDLVESLNNLGAEISYLENIGFPPLKIRGKKFKGGKIPLYASVSSQFVSALCMIAPILENGLQIHLDGKIASSSYINMTLVLMKHFGVNSDWNGEVIEIPEQKYEPRDIEIETDWSAAAPFFQIAALCDDADLFLLGLAKESLQGDHVLTEIFDQLGVGSCFEKYGLRLQHNSESMIQNSLFEFDFSNCPDLVQPVAVTCAAKNIPARLNGIENLQHKETDRIHSLQVEMKKFGVDISFQFNQVRIEGEFQRKERVVINTYNDHRMAMSFSPIASICNSVEIENPEVVKKSFPDFWKQLLIT